MPPRDLSAPIGAACAIAITHELAPDRHEILQNGNTLVLRLSESLVARVVNDPGGPRQASAWFEREIAVAEYLARHGAPVIPVHPDIPPGPHEHLGYPVNFWQFVKSISEEPEPAAIGRSLFACHALLEKFTGELPELAILDESLSLLDTLREKELFPPDVLQLLHDRLTSSRNALRAFPFQPLHGDAHLGNLMNTTRGLLWTDWEDTFLGPVEWDLASVIWNARILDEDHTTADGILDAYRHAGGAINADALHQSLIARAAVMSAWYPILYPQASPERLEKLRRRLEWLGSQA